MPRKKHKITLKRASIFKRLLAFTIDILILETLVLFPFRWYFFKNIPEHLRSHTIYLTDHLKANTEYYLIGYIFTLLIIILYFTTYEFLLNSTPGKHIMKIQTICLTGKATFTQILIKNLQLFIIVPIWLIDLLGFATKRRERFLDTITKISTVNKIEIRV